MNIWWFKSAIAGGPIGGCQVDKSGGTHSMGFIQSKPIAGLNMISLQYLGGDPCHVGKPTQSQRSTRINFYCSKTEVW